MKYIIPAIIILGIIFFAFGFQTYFIKTEIQEEAPVIMDTTTIIGEGTFGQVDAIHRGSGKAILIEENGERILRLEDFSVTSGPDLYVYLSDSENPTHGKGSLGNFVEIGLLKATSGNQNYTIPEGTPPYNTVVIWCKKYGVLFSYASLQ